MMPCRNGHPLTASIVYDAVAGTGYYCSVCGDSLSSPQRERLDRRKARRAWWRDLLTVWRRA